MTGASVTSIARGWGTPASSVPSCREAVLGALGDDRELMSRFARACSEGIPALLELGQPVRRVLQERRHRYETHDEQLEETLAALHDLAHKLLPASPGAALARLRARVAERDGEPHSAVETIEELVASDDGVLNEILRAAMSGHEEYVMYAARNIYSDLKRLGQRFEPRNFSMHVRVVIIELHPGYLEHWAAWCKSERHRAIMYICSRSRDIYLPDLDAEFREAADAEDALDRARFTAAIRTIVRSALRALKREGFLVPDPSTLIEPSAQREPERDGEPASLPAVRAR